MRQLYLFFLVLLVAGCDRSLIFEENSNSGKQVITFAITCPGSEVEEVRTKSDHRPIGNLIYAIFDSQNKRVYAPHQLLRPDFSSLSVEGLRDGSYSIIFLGTADKDCPLLISELIDTNQKWISNSIREEPINYDCFHKSFSFEVGSNSTSRSIPIQLERSVGRVGIRINAASEYSKGFITKVEVSYNANTSVATHQFADGSYGGSDVIRDFDITNTLGFYSFPSTQKLTGTVRITALRSDHSTFIRTYNFSNAGLMDKK